MNNISDRLQDLYDTLYEKEIEKIDNELYERYSESNQETKKVILESVVKKRLEKIKRDLKTSKEMLEKIINLDKIFSLNYRNINYSLRENLVNLKVPQIRSSEIYNELPIIEYICTNAKNLSRREPVIEYSDNITKDNFLNYTNILIPLLIDGYMKGSLNLGMFISEDDYAKFLKSNRQELKLPFLEKKKKNQKGKKGKKKKRFSGGKKDKRDMGRRNQQRNKQKFKQKGQEQKNRVLFNIYKNIYLPGGETIYKKLNNNFNNSSKKKYVLHTNGSVRCGDVMYGLEEEIINDIKLPMINSPVPILGFKIEIENKKDYCYRMDRFKTVNNVGSHLNEKIKKVIPYNDCSNIDSVDINLENMVVKLEVPYVKFKNIGAAGGRQNCKIEINEQFRKQLNQLIYLKKLSKMLNFDFLLSTSVEERNFLILRKYFFRFLTESFRYKIKYLEKLSTNYSQIFGLSLNNINNKEDSEKERIIKLLRDMIENIEFKLYKERNNMSSGEIRYWENAKRDLEGNLSSIN